MIKKIISIVLAMTFCLGLSIITLAVGTDFENFAIEPRLDSGQSVFSQISISGNTADLYSKVSGKSGTTKVVVTQVLQKKSGSSYRDVSGAKWTKTYNSDFALMTHSCRVSSGVTYRVKTTAKITGSNGTDTVTKYSASSTC